MKTAELTGSALDWAVAKALGDELFMKCVEYPEYARHFQRWGPSTNAEHAVKIMEKEKISVGYSHTDKLWTAHIKPVTCDLDIPLFVSIGPTMLVAAMRVFVEASLGDEVELPGSLQ